MSYFVNITGKVPPPFVGPVKFEFEPKYGTVSPNKYFTQQS